VQAAPVFEQTDLVSSVSGVAPVTDPNLRNPWGLTSSPTSPFWVANQVSGTSTLYNGAGQPFPVGSPRVVTIPPLAGASASGPTGIVFNSTSDFALGPGAPAAIFLFAALDGTISGWNPTVNPTSSIRMAAEAGAVYTALALARSGSGSFLYAANGPGARIDVYDGSFTRVSLAGSFTDPVLPAGFTPYNIQNLGGTLYVTYENEDSGGGVVDAFDLNGNLLRRVTANADGGPLDDPWGLAIAPDTFGDFAGALLVGNEGDGRINAFDPATGTWLGALRDSGGDPIANPGLWGLLVGNDGNGGDSGTLYFVAGIEDEREGLLGAIRLVDVASVPEPASWWLLVLGACALLIAARRRA
jgi:uncharacterized protein (TIGR03118 family)